MSSCTAFDLTPVVEWVENYFRERRLREVARQHMERLRCLMDRLRGLLPDAEMFEKSLELTLKRADAMEKSGDVGGAVVLLDAEIADLHHQIKTIEERLERRVTDLQRRFHALHARVSALRSGAGRLETFVQAAVSAAWPAAERDRLLARAREAQQQITVPAATAADLSAEGVRKLEETEAEFAAAELALKTAQLELEKDLAATQKRLLSEKLGLAKHRTVTIAEFLAQQPRPAAAPDADEDRMARSSTRCSQRSACCKTPPAGPTSCAALTLCAPRTKPRAAVRSTKGWCSKPVAASRNSAPLRSGCSAWMNCSPTPRRLPARRWTPSWPSCATSAAPVAPWT